MLPAAAGSVSRFDPGAGDRRHPSKLPTWTKCGYTSAYLKLIKPLTSLRAAGFSLASQANTTNTDQQANDH